MRDIRIIFMGTPDFAVATLEALIAHQMNVVGVITAPDRPAGRGQQLRQSAVKQYATAQDLYVMQPTNLKDPDFIKELEGREANLQIVVAFRMLPEVVWKMPAYGTFNLHASLLPQYRGAAPINWAIINGDTETGVTTFFIDEKIDTGAIIKQRKTPIHPSDTVGDLHDRLMHIGSTLVIDTVNAIAEDTVTATVQALEGKPKTAYKLNPENTKINWSQPVQAVYNHIRGLSPYPVAYSILVNNDKEERAKVYNAFAKAYEEQTNTPEPGTIQVEKESINVATQDGWICITEIQLPGNRKMEVKSLLNGYTLSENAKMR